MIVLQLRTYFSTYTASRLLIDGSFAGMVLEDSGRPGGVKIPRETCLPEGVYKVGWTLSARFGRDMLILYNKADYSVDVGGVRFTGIRVHEGANVTHTDGCILYGEKVDDGVLKRGGLLELEQHISDAVKRGTVHWVIGRDFLE